MGLVKTSVPTKFVWAYFYLDARYCIDVIIIIIISNRFFVRNGMDMKYLYNIYNNFSVTVLLLKNVSSTCAGR